MPSAGTVTPASFHAVLLLVLLLLLQLPVGVLDPLPPKLIFSSMDTMVSVRLQSVRTAVLVA